MKKLLLLLAATFLVANYSLAQYQPQKGDITTEVQFNPFDQNGKTFKLDGIKVRYFFTDVDAFRVKLGFGMKHDNFSAADDNRVENSNSDYTSTSESYKTTSGDFELNLGYERHFNLGKRFSSYVGASVGFNRHFASARVESIETRHYLAGKYWDSNIISQEQVKITNGTFNELPDTEPGTNENPLDKIDNRANWEIKAALFAGVDFYVYKGLYLGTELGLGLNSTHSSKIKFETSDSKEVVTFESKDKIRTTNLGFYIEPTIRLGWAF